MVCSCQLGYGAVHSVSDQIATMPSRTHSSPKELFSSHPSFDDGCTMEKLPQTVELSLMDVIKMWLIPLGCGQGGGGWPDWWHLMECTAFYLRDVNLCPDLGWRKTCKLQERPFSELDHTAPDSLLKVLYPQPQAFGSYIGCSLSLQWRQNKQMGILSLLWCSQTRQKLPCSLWMGRNTPLICVQVIPR